MMSVIVDGLRSRYSQNMQPPEVRYQAIQCRFIGDHVWAIVTQTPEGAWRIANCLDKDATCCGTGCAFTDPGGAWPYDAPEQEKCGRRT